MWSIALIRSFAISPPNPLVASLLSFVRAVALRKGLPRRTWCSSPPGLACRESCPALTHRSQVLLEDAVPEEEGEHHPRQADPGHQEKSVVEGLLHRCHRRRARGNRGSRRSVGEAEAKDQDGRKDRCAERRRKALAHIYKSRGTGKLALRNRVVRHHLHHLTEHTLAETSCGDEQ